MANTDTKKEIEVIEPGASTEVDFKPMSEASIPGLDMEPTINQSLIDELEVKIASKKEDIKNKVYAVTMTSETFLKYEDFIQNDAEWAGTEALGVKEINKQIQKIKKEGGVKNSVVFMGALPLEASHYFISKSRGKGCKSAEEFLSLYKAFDQALDDAKEDAKEIKNLEKELAAAMQGIELA